MTYIYIYINYNYYSIFTVQLDRIQFYINIVKHMVNNVSVVVE